MTREGHLLFLTIFAAGCAAGCGDRTPAVYPTYAPPPVAYRPVAGSENGFDDYALVADDVEQNAGKQLTRVSFTPGQRRDAQKLLEPYVRKIALAARRHCDFEFSAHGPFDPTPHQRGWRLIGWCLYWDIQDAVANGDLDKAVSNVILATRFGFDLTGGGAVDASTGLRVVDDARKALALYLDRLSPEQLRVLEDGLKLALARKPPISRTIANEKANMMETIQTLQDYYRDGKLEDEPKKLNRFVAEFGPDVREPVAGLSNLQPKDPKRLHFFKSLADYAEANAAYANRLALAPASQASKVPGPTAPVDKAWKRLAKYVVRAPIALVSIDDASVARTRLFIIEAELTRRQKLHMAMPTDLSGFSSPLSIDPYSGAPFGYHSSGEEYRVYSVGKDGLDNDGQTDTSYTQPDLRLEKPSS